MGKENKSRYALLGMLSLGPMSGYDLKKTIEFSIGNFWNESYAQIYPMLKQLAAEGLASSHVEKQAGKPDRYVYEITDKGRNELHRWLAEPAEYQPQRNELLLKLFFGGRIPSITSMQHIQEFRDHIAQLLQRYQETEAAIKDEFAQSADLPYWLITLGYGKHTAQALLNWCDETLETLEQLANKPSERTTNDAIS